MTKPINDRNSPDRRNGGDCWGSAPHDHVASFTCAHVIEDGMSILYVSHDYDGGWQFLCGGEHTLVSEGRVVCGKCLVEGDPSLTGIDSLQIDHFAERASANDRDWTITALPRE